MTEVTTTGMIRKETNTVTRWIHPQIASPVAVSAGLRASTVSVKLAIQGVKATPRPSESTASMIASV